MHWIGVCANHLDGKGNEAIKVIDAYGETVKEEGRERNYENSGAVPETCWKRVVSMTKLWTI